jgi:hypothetical protein
LSAEGQLYTPFNSRPAIAKALLCVLNDNP